jgi:hypothetical protein
MRRRDKVIVQRGAQLLDQNMVDFCSALETRIENLPRSLG